MIVAGIGFSTKCTAESLRDALQRACVAAQTSTPHHLATAEDKVTSLAPLAQHLGLPLVAVSHADLADQETQTQSARVEAERGIGSVAEAAALSAAGPGARLLTPRVHAKDRLASCAIAEGNPK